MVDKSGTHAKICKEERTTVHFVSSCLKRPLLNAPRMHFFVFIFIQLIIIGRGFTISQLKARYKHCMSKHLSAALPPRTLAFTFIIAPLLEAE